MIGISNGLITETGASISIYEGDCFSGSQSGLWYTFIYIQMHRRINQIFIEMLCKTKENE